jgi:hypothetical protein
MSTVERLRPQIDHLDPEWSARTLQTILSSHDPSHSRHHARGRRLSLIAATTAGVLGVGGVAYATGLVPALIAEDLDWISSSDVSNVHEVASFSIESNGKTRTFEIWLGINADGQNCTSVLEAEGKFGPEFGGYCGHYPTDAWFGATSESYKGAIDDTPPRSTTYVYGEPTLSGVTTVRVVGDGFDHRVAVDETTGGYAVAVPELRRGASGRFATVEFIDADGTVLGTRALSEK